MKRWKRINWAKLWNERPDLLRTMHCEGVVALMAREGVDVDIDGVYKYYDDVIVPNRDKR